MEHEIMMGRMPEMFMNGNAQNITFCVTEDCNLRCKYCYMDGKNSLKKWILKQHKML